MEPRIHPFIAGASVAVILLSGVGIAAVTGYLPGSSAQRMPEQAKKASEKPKAHPVAKTQIASAAPHAKAACVDCGVVVNVREVEVKGKASAVGAEGGAGVAGGGAQR